MPDAVHILLSTIFVNNFVTVQFLGLCPFMGASQRLETSIGMGMATTFVLTLACATSYLLQTYLLVPYQIEYLRIIVFIVIIASLVQLSQIVMRATQPLLNEALGVFMPLITTNCAVLGVSLLNIKQSHDFTSSVFYGFGAALGFSMLLVVFAAIREKQDIAAIPLPFRGAAINMITAGIMSLGFMGFTGIN